MRLRLMRDLVAVRRKWLGGDQQYPKTELIEVPADIQLELTPFGEVLGVAQGVNECVRGDKVLFNPYHTLMLRGGVALVRERDVIAALEEWPEHAVVVQDEAREYADE